MGDLLAMTLDESSQIHLHGGPAERWSGVEADVRLAYGTPVRLTYATLNDQLARALPRARVLPIPHSGHDGLNRAPRRLVEPLEQFLAAPARTSRAGSR